jgi:hypothetical protein
MKPLNNYFSVSPYPGSFQAAVCVSFDYETSAQSKRENVINRIVTDFFEINNKFKLHKLNTNTRHGRGLGNRRGAEKIIKLFKDRRIHGTWFSTGHILLKNNINSTAYRINQIMPYMNKNAGFHETLWWHSHKPCFHHDPHSDFQRHPFFYLGDQAELLRNMGEDIQYHTFSHPYIPFETNENLITDLEDWQVAANENGFHSPSIMAFPFLGDYYLFYPKLKLSTVPTKVIEGYSYQIMCLSDKQINLFYERGIEVFTRCGSKNDEAVFKGFHRYNNSDVHYLKHCAIRSLLHSEAAIENKINEIIEKEATVDFWIHPNDIWQDKDFFLFSIFIEHLITRYHQDIIWLASLQEMWSYFKINQQIKLHFNMVHDNEIHLIVCNNNNKGINKLTIDYKNISFDIEDDNCKLKNNKILIRKSINPHETYSIRMKNFYCINERSNK